MKFFALAIFAIVIVAANAKPSLVGGWGWGHGAVAPGGVLVGPAGSIAVGPSSAGAVIPGVGWAGHGVWGDGLWGGHGAWGGHWW